MEQDPLHIDIVGSIRHLVACLVLGGVCLLASFSHVNADVYSDSKKSLQDNTDAVVSMLSKSAVPGGTRSITINGNKMLVKRFANPVSDDSEFYNVWKSVNEQKLKYNAAILSVVDENGRRDPVTDALTSGVPYQSPIHNIKFFLSATKEFAESQSAKLKEKVSDAIEAPFAYETNQHRVIAKIPIKAIDKDSELARADSESGYLFMSEKAPGTTASSAFWQMQFGEKFNYGDLFGRNGEAGEDVEGEEPIIARYPGSRMTLVFDEAANAWHSQSWSYESRGDVLSHVSHYISAFDQAGFSKNRGSVVQSQYGLIEFASAHKQATLFVELVDPSTHSVQVTLQMRGN